VNGGPGYADVTYAFYVRQSDFSSTVLSALSATVSEQDVVLKPRLEDGSDDSPDGFNPEHSSYNLYFSGNGNEVSIKAEALAGVLIDGESGGSKTYARADVKASDDPVLITVSSGVTATPRVYSVYFKRENPQPATLSTLSFSGAFFDAGVSFDRDVLSYDALVYDGTPSVVLRASVQDGLSARFSPSSVVPAQNGLVVSVHVSGGPDYTDSVYQITLKMQLPQHPRLSSLSLSADDVEAELLDDKLVYPLTAPYGDGGEADVPFAWSVDESQVKSVFYSFNEGSSWIEDTGKDGFSGGLSLSPGESAVVLIKVLTFDGKTGVYYIPVNRAPDNSAALSALTVSGSGGTAAWSPAFSPNDASALNYTVAFPKDTSISTQDITLTATAASPAAKVEFVGETGSQFTLAPGGQKTAVIRVTAQNGSCLDYKISVTWEVATYTVNFMDGSTTKHTYTVSYNGTQTLPALPTKEGAVAKGWYTASSGGQKLSGITHAITADTDFYVQWLASTNAVIQPNASGGDSVSYVSTTSGFDEVHVFKNSGNLIVFNAPADSTVRMLVVAGGGGGGYSAGADWRAGGGGGGGVIIHNSYSLSAGTIYAVTVGAGGANSTSMNGAGSNGLASKFGSAFEAKGGGGGGSHGPSVGNLGAAGGSGGGGGGTTGGSSIDQAAPSGALKYGNAGGYGGGGFSGGGGGGAGGVGGSTSTTRTGAMGGIGISSDITGSAVYYGGGGAAGGVNNSNSNYGANGGVSGATNTGDGGGGGGGSSSSPNYGGPGGSGIVVVRFPYKYAGN
jgi:hypothetical protein